jgi:hypothetical protein
MLAHEDLGEKHAGSDRLSLHKAAAASWLMVHSWPNQWIEGCIAEDVMLSDAMFWAHSHSCYPIPSPLMQRTAPVNVSSCHWFARNYNSSSIRPNLLPIFKPRKHLLSEKLFHLETWVGMIGATTRAMGTYQHYGVDPERGCAVVLRPDQYVGFVTEVDDYEGIDHFVSGFYGGAEAAE